MRKKAREGSATNNFFTLASIVIVSIVILVSSKYVTNQSEKIRKEEVIPLSCEKDVFTVSKVYNQQLLNKSINALNEGSYSLQGHYKKSHNNPSIIEDFVSIFELDSYFVKSISKSPIENNEKDLNIKYYIIENDKKDENARKLSNCKLCSGAILTSFLIAEEEIFKFYIDFNLYDKKEIEEKIDCTIKVYKNHVKKI